MSSQPYQPYDLSRDLSSLVPVHALRVLEALERAGAEAWVVGGWVRDALRGRPAHDVDITTSARWQEVERILHACDIEVHETGTAHGTLTAVIEGKPIEVTTYRIEGTYSDHRHPDEVRFVRDVREDLARRDFTINAMAFHPARGLLDPFGGRDDLVRGVIRAVGDPDGRFGEDALRVLRALRFAARLGFAIEGRTQKALRTHASGLRSIASERIGQELSGIVMSGRLAWALMAQTEVMCEAIPELRACVGFEQHSPYHAYDVFEHTARVCRAVEEFTGGLAAAELRWAAMMHDIAKPQTFTRDESGRGHFFGHPRRGADVTQGVLRRLALPKELVASVVALIRLHDHPLSPTERSVSRMLLALERACPGHARELAFSLIDLKRADAVSKTVTAASYAIELDRMGELLRRRVARGVCCRVSDLAVGGADVMRELGAAPGPLVGTVLADLLAQVIDGRLPNEREVLLDAIRTKSKTRSKRSLGLPEDQS